MEPMRFFMGVFVACFGASDLKGSIPRRAQVEYRLLEFLAILRQFIMPRLQKVWSDRELHL